MIFNGFSYRMPAIVASTERPSHRQRQQFRRWKCKILLQPQLAAGRRTGHHLHRQRHMVSSTATLSVPTTQSTQFPIFNFFLILFFVISGKLLCVSPEVPDNGLLTPDLTHYEIGASIMISCRDDFKYIGRPWLVCLQDGTWSSSVGLCTSSV